MRIIVARKSTANVGSPEATAVLLALGYDVTENLTATLEDCRAYDIVVLDASAWALSTITGGDAFLQALLVDGQQVLCVGNDTDTTTYWVATAVNTGWSGFPVVGAATKPAGLPHDIWKGVTSPLPSDGDSGFHVRTLQSGISTQQSLGAFSNDALGISVVLGRHVAGGRFLFIPRFNILNGNANGQLFLRNVVLWLQETVAELAGLTNNERVFLVKFSFGAGSVFITTGARDLTVAGQVYTAVGGSLGIGQIEESSDMRGQGVDIVLSGIDQTIVSTLLGQTYRGRALTVTQAFLDAQTGAVIETLLLFEGVQVDPYEIEEVIKRGQAGTVTIRTRGRPRLGMDEYRGIRCNVHSHQHYAPGDLFFQQVASIAGQRVYWGNTAPWVPDPFIHPHQDFPNPFG